MVNRRCLRVKDTEAHESINNVVPTHELRRLAHQEVADLINRDALLTRMPVTIRLLAQEWQEILDPLDGFDELIPVDFVNFVPIPCFLQLHLLVDCAKKALSPLSGVSRSIVVDRWLLMLLQLIE